MSKNDRIFESVEELIGSTPMVKMGRSLQNVPSGEWLKKQASDVKLGNVRSEVFAKVEFMNPGGSVKDRIARTIIRKAESRGQLKPGATIVELLQETLVLAWP